MIGIVLQTDGVHVVDDSSATEARDRSSGWSGR